MIIVLKVKELDFLLICNYVSVSVNTIDKAKERINSYLIHERKHKKLYLKKYNKWQTNQQNNKWLISFTTHQHHEMLTLTFLLCTKLCFFSFKDNQHLQIFVIKIAWKKLFVLIFCRAEKQRACQKKYHFTPTRLICHTFLIPHFHSLILQK